MTREHLQHLKTQVENDSHLPAEARASLLALITQAEQDSTDDAPPSTPDVSNTPLQAALTELEAAHPEITSFLNRTAVALGNMGI